MARRQHRTLSPGLMTTYSDHALHAHEPNSSTCDPAFAAYLAAQFIARKGFSPHLSVSELEPARDACDYLLLKHDGMQLSAVCIVNCETDTQRAFGLSAERLRELADGCRRYAGRIGFSKMPVSVQVIEVRARALDALAHKRLAAYKRRSPLSKSFITAWALDTTNATVWTNAPIAARWSQGGWLKHLLTAPRTPVSADDNGRRLLQVKTGWPWLTFVIAATLVAMYGVEIAFAVPPGAGWFSFDTQTLFALGGLNPVSVFQDGEWYRMATAALLHGGIAHLLFNLVALLLAGFSAERLMGSAWFAATFVLGAAAGAALSLSFGAAGMVAVGASGAIMALLAAGLICSLRLVDNAERLQIQMRLMFMLIPSLIPSATSHDIGGATDYAAHFGGALVGTVIGVLLRISWRRHAATPPAQPLAAIIAGIGILLAAWSLTAVAAHYPRYAEVVEYIPDARIPGQWSDLSAADAADLAHEFPDDPRGHYTLGRTLLLKARYPEAEQAFRDALAAYEAHSDDFLDAFESEARIFIALSLALQDRGAEARQEAAPLCDEFDTGDRDEALTAYDLCTLPRS
ncbi:rhomboid family intramembrane serine protease [Salinisphaera shabanensis]|nr:rhomboid family intramembrane serine protease [Salinisphaera shabanensis]